MKYDNQKITKIKKQIKKGRDFGLGFVVNTLYQNLKPYTIATDRRLWKQSEKVEDKNSDAYHAGTFSSALSSLIGLVLQATIYFENPEYLTIPVTTNIISIIYEQYKIKKINNL